MSHIIDIGLVSGRLLIFCFAVLLIYIAVFLREDEEGKLQNRLEELWIRISDRERVALTRHGTFLRSSLSIYNRVLLFLFGRTLFSVRTYSLISIYALCSFSVSLLYDQRWYIAYSRWLHFADVMAWLRNTRFLSWLGHSWFRYLHYDYDSYKRSTPILILFVIFICIRGALAICTDETDDADDLTWLSKILIVMGSFIPLVVLLLPSVVEYNIVIILIALPIGLLSGIVFVMLNRVVIRISLHIANGFYVVLAANLIVTMVYLNLFYRFDGFKLPKSVNSLVGFVGATNLMSGLVALSVVAVMVFILLHRLFWPFLSRPIYAIVRHNVVRKPTLLLSIAVILLTWSIPAWMPFWEIVKRL